MDELEALVVLSSFSGLGSKRVRQLIYQYGSAVEALQTSPEELERSGIISAKGLAAWQHGLSAQRWRTTLSLVHRLHTHLIPYTHPHYPPRLLETEDFPLILYVRGEIRPEDSRCLAIVGTRHATLYGQEVARAWSRSLAQSGFTIVSGLARGIDTAAHIGALEGGGRTDAILGCGLASIYPRENSQLASEIEKQGALLSELPMETPPARSHFPRRNRIVSGMSLGTLLIEAPLKSGAMLTVQQTHALHRPVFVVPGRLDQPSFAGNHTLLSRGEGRCVTCPEEIIAYFGFSSSQMFSSSPPLSAEKLTEEEAECLRQMPSHEATIDQLTIYLGRPAAALNSLLMRLVLKKLVKEYPGRVYKKHSALTEGGTHHG